MSKTVTITHPSPRIADKEIPIKQWEKLDAMLNNGGWKLKQDVGSKSDKGNTKKSGKSGSDKSSEEAGS